MKTINWKNIYTPTSVEGFRINLKKYFVCIGKDREMLMTRGEETAINVDEIDSFADLYKQGVQKITPTIQLNVNRITEDEVLINMGSRDFSSVLSDKDRFPIYEMNSAEDTMKFIQTKNPCWYSMDNQILRAFYYKTLGDFSGYSSDMGWS